MLSLRSLETRFSLRSSELWSNAVNAATRQGDHFSGREMRTRVALFTPR